MGKNQFILGIIFVVCILSIGFVVAEDGEDNQGENSGENEFEGEDSGFGTAAIVFFAISLTDGLIIFLSQKKPFMELLKKWKINIKLLWKIHHPFTLIAIGLWIVHGVLITGSNIFNFGEGSLTGWITGILFGSLLVTGVLFTWIKKTPRIILRYIHLFLMITGGIMMAIHVGNAD